MKISIEPYCDDANSYPPDVDFELGQRTIIIRMHNPEREVQILYKDAIKVLKFICDGCEDD